MAHKFMCGCTTAPRRGYESRRDEYGFNVCPEHGDRELGWRSNVKERATEIEIHYSPSMDRRDNRDPEEIGREILSAINGSGADLGTLSELRRLDS